MKKAGRPKLAEEDKVKNQLIAVDYADYLKIKKISDESNKKLKTVVHDIISKNS